MRKSRFGLTVLVVVASISVSDAADWPRFRGPNGTGIAADKDIPVQWNEKDGILWKVPIPGVGNSSPIVWGKRLFLQSSATDGSARQLLCIDVTNGKELWTQSVPGKRARINDRNSWASSTPATDGERVYALFWDGESNRLHTYDFDGKPLWDHSFGGFKSQHGAAHSPIVEGGKVFVAHDQDGASELVALDAKSGKLVWEKPRKPFRTCYSVPFLLTTPGRAPELIVASTAGITSYDPETGGTNWEWTWTFDRSPLRTVGSPVYGQGLVFATSGDGSGDRHMIAVKAGGKGDVTSSNLVWENKKVFPYVPTMITWGDHLYSVNDFGIAACNVASTGEEVWTKRLGGNVSASPVLIDGKIYVCTEAGEVYVIAAEPKFKQLARNSMGEGVMATPAVADGRLFFRGKTHLFCIGKAAAK